MLMAQNTLKLGDAPITGAGAIGEQVAQNVGSQAGITAIFSQMLSNVIGLITVIGGLFFVVYMLIAGFDWLRAADKSGVEKAQHRMVNGAIGLLVMILSLGIAGIIGGVFGIDLLDPASTFLKLLP